MNIAVIFAGGTGQRMHSKSVPKQFLKLYDKPIITYTLEKFQYHPQIDGIILVILSDWVSYCEQQKQKYGLTKVKAIIPGGASALQSVYLGIRKAKELYGDDSIVLIHDGVRPLIDEDTISADIACVKEKGNAITVTKAIETILISDNGAVDEIIERSQCEMARAPQAFYLGDISSVFEKASAEDNLAFIDTASMMKHYGYKLHTVVGKPENIKITTPTDFYVFRAMLDMDENSQLFR